MPVKCYINDLPLVFGINSTSIKITYQILMLITNTIIADCRGAIYSFFFFVWYGYQKYDNLVQMDQHLTGIKSVKKKKSFRYLYEGYSNIVKMD